MYGLNIEYTDRVNWLVDRCKPFTKAEIHQVYSRSRKRGAIETRMITWHIMKKYTDLSLGKLGSIFVRDHATVLHSEKVFNNLFDTDITFRENVKQIESEFKGTFMKLSGYKTNISRLSISIFTSEYQRSNKDIGRVLLGI